MTAAQIEEKFLDCARRRPWERRRGPEKSMACSIRWPSAALGSPSSGPLLRARVIFRCRSPANAGTHIAEVCGYGFPLARERQKENIRRATENKKPGPQGRDRLYANATTNAKRDQRAALGHRQYDDLGADVDAAVEVDHVRVDHADAARRHRGPMVEGALVPWMR